MSMQRERLLLQHMSMYLIRVAENFDTSSEQLIKLWPQKLRATFGQIDDGFQSRIVLAAFDGFHRHLKQNNMT